MTNKIPPSVRTYDGQPARTITYNGQPVSKIMYDGMEAYECNYWIIKDGEVVVDMKDDIGAGGKLDVPRAMQSASNNELSKGKYGIIIGKGDFSKAKKNYYTLPNGDIEIMVVGTTGLIGSPNIAVYGVGENAIGGVPSTSDRFDRKRFPIDAKYDAIIDVVFLLDLHTGRPIEGEWEETKYIMSMVFDEFVDPMASATPNPSLDIKQGTLDWGIFSEPLSGTSIYDGLWKRVTKRATNRINNGFGVYAYPEGKRSGYAPGALISLDLTGGTKSKFLAGTVFTVTVECLNFVICRHEVSDKVLSNVSGGE